MSLNPSLLRIETGPSGPIIFLCGSWRLRSILASVQDIEQHLLSLPPASSLSGKLSLDGSELQDIDTASALVLLKPLFSKTREIELSNFSDETQSILNLVRENWQPPPKLREIEKGFFSRIGRSIVKGISEINSLLSFIGQTLTEVLRVVFQPRSMRWKELFVQIEQTLLNAVPVVSLVMVLIGIVIAYLFSIQLERYGANIFIVDGSGLAICRELSPVIVAIIVAGRSGSAFTAQIGTMKLNEEVDALLTLGLSPMRVLVLPRFLALVIALPILVFLGDVVGLFGGAIIADERLGITGPTFITRLRDVLPLRSFVVGLIKAPVFAAFIAVIGCRRGLNVENNARSIGLSTTATVVESIVSVILLNAAFAIIFTELKI